MKAAKPAEPASFCLIFAVSRERTSREMLPHWSGCEEARGEQVRSCAMCLTPLRLRLVPLSEGSRMRQPFGRPLTLLTTVAVMALTAMTWMAVDPQSTVRAMPAASPQSSTATRAAVVARCLSSILRRLSQRADEGEFRRPLAREHRSRRCFQPLRNAREGRPQAAQGADAAARPSASRCRHARGVRRLARKRPRRARAPAAERRDASCRAG